MAISATKLTYSSATDWSGELLAGARDKKSAGLPVPRRYLTV